MVRWHLFNGARRENPGAPTPPGPPLGKGGTACAAVALGVILTAWVSAPAAQVPKNAAAATVEETRASDVRDGAGLFQAETIAAARKELRDEENKTGVATVIATIETLADRPIEDEARRMATEAGTEGIFILISKKEKKIQVLTSHRYPGETLKRQRDVIRSAFIEGFRHGNFDRGLKLGVAAIREVACGGAAGRRACCKARLAGCRCRRRRRRRAGGSRRMGGRHAGAAQPGAPGFTGSAAAHRRGAGKGTGFEAQREHRRGR